MTSLRLDPGVAALAIFFALAPAFAVGGALGVAVLTALLGVACMRLSLARTLWEKKPLFIALLALFWVWTALASTWSPYAAASTQALKIAIITATGLAFASVASGPGRRLALAGGIATVVVLLPLLAIEAATPLLFNRAAQPGMPDGELTRNVSRATSFLVTLSWGAAGALLLMGGRLLTLAAITLTIATGAISTQFEQASNFVGFFAGLLAFAAGYATPRFAIWMIVGGWAFWLIGAPMLTPLVTSNTALMDAMPLSWAMRGGIWDFAIERIWMQPLFGQGLEASRTVTDLIVVRGLETNAIANHPHSASLQIWLELGLVGVALGVGLLMTGGRWLSRAYGDRRITAAASAATLATAGVIANVSFSAWAEWWIATMFVAAGVVGALGARETLATRALS